MIPARLAPLLIAAVCLLLGFSCFFYDIAVAPERVKRGRFHEYAYGDDRDEAPGDVDLAGLSQWQRPKRVPGDEPVKDVMSAAHYAPKPWL